MGTGFSEWIASLNGAWGPLADIGIPGLLATVAGILIIILAVYGVIEALIGFINGGASGEDSGRRAAKGREQLKAGTIKFFVAILFTAIVGIAFRIATGLGPATGA